MLVIKDLRASKALDRNAMASVVGGAGYDGWATKAAPVPAILLGGALSETFNYVGKDTVDQRNI